MQKQKTKLSELNLVGLTVRTNNKDEMNPSTAKIGAVAAMYRNKQIADKIKNRSKPGVTYCIYTDFASDENGEYTYFIGEVVDSLSQQDSQLKTLTIPKSEYQKFTTNPGSMPDVIISAWQKLWTMTESDFGGKRTYIADFEVYDEKAHDPQNTVVDIYIGIKS